MEKTPAQYALGLVPTSIIDGATGWASRLGAITPSPDQIVVFTDGPGQSPNPRWNIDYPVFQIITRGKKGEYDTVWRKARAVRDALLGIDSQDVGVANDRLVNITGLGDLGFIGFDDSDRPMFSMNFRTIMHPASTGHREAL